MTSIAREAKPEKGAPAIFTGPFIIGTLVNFLLYVNYYTLMVVMASYCLSAYNADLSVAGFAASIFIVGALIARFLAGAFIDRIGRKRALAISALVETLFSASYLLGGGMGIIVLFAIRTIHGFFYGIAQSTVTTIVTDLVPDERKGEGIGYFTVSAAVGSAIGPFLGMALMQYLGFTVLFLICTAVAAVSFIGALLVREPKKTASPLDEYPRSTTAQTAARPPRHKVTIRDFIEISALPISIAVAIPHLAYGAVITYLSAFAIAEGFLSAAAFFFVVYSLVMMVCRPFTGRMFDRRGDFGVMILGFATFMGGLLLLSQAHGDIAVLIAGGLLGMGIGAMMPCGLTLAVQKAPDDHLAVTNTTYYIFIDVAIGAAPLLFGWLIPAIGYRGLYLSLVGAVAIGLVLYLIFRKKKML